MRHAVSLPQACHRQLLLALILRWKVRDTSRHLDALQSLVMQPSDAGSHAVTGRDPHKPTILGKFLVKPSEVFHFVEAAELITKAVSEQEGSLVYGFSKTLLVGSLGLTFT